MCSGLSSPRRLLMSSTVSGDAPSFAKIAAASPGRTWNIPKIIMVTMNASGTSCRMRFARYWVKQITNLPSFPPKPGEGNRLLPSPGFGWISHFLCSGRDSPTGRVFRERSTVHSAQYPGTGCTFRTGHPRGWDCRAAERRGNRARASAPLQSEFAEPRSSSPVALPGQE